MTILVAGNKNYGLSASVNKVCSDATFLSRTTGYDLTSSDIQQQVA
jgi:hypothetical protein